MNTTTTYSLSFPLPRFLALLLVCFSSSLAAQSVPLKIQQARSQVTISWQSNLGLVQPQRTTNLSATGWLDLGAATSATNTADITVARQAFYRLRFLAPTIIAPPLGQSVLIGSNAIFNVTATGTAPLVYQWRKNSTNLAGQTAATLSLKAASLNDAGGYSVVVGNSVGAATSIVAVLLVANPLASPHGIYMGKFASQTNAAGFAIVIRTNGTMIVLGDSAPQAGGVFGTNVALSANGSFSTPSIQSGTFSGSFASDGVSGTLTSTNGAAPKFTGTRKADAGIHQANVGYYEGTFGGLLTGNVFVILAADGSEFSYLASALGSGGAFGTITAANILSATTAFTLPGTTVPGALQIDGTLSPATHQLTGTYSFSGITLGTFSLTRIATP